MIPSPETEPDPHSFEDCPSCGGSLQYPTQSDVVCGDCGDEFMHEIRSNGHLLWSFTDDYKLDEVVDRA